MSVKSRAREHAARPETAPPPFFMQGVPKAHVVQPSLHIDPNTGVRTALTYKYVPVNADGEKITLKEYVDTQEDNKKLEDDEKTAVYWALGAF